MLAVLISIKPEWVQKILNGEKTIEFRLTMPKYQLPCKVYIYCTKSKPNLCDRRNANITLADFEFVNNPSSDDVVLNGKVVAEFTLNKVDKIGLADAFRKYGLWLMNDETVLEDSQIEQILSDSCLTYNQLTDYIGCGDVEDWTFENGYAWHIDDLKIYDKPKELSDFQKDLDSDDYPCNKGEYCDYEYYDRSIGCNACGIDFNGDHCMYKQLTRAPQSWCYVEELEAV